MTTKLKLPEVTVSMAPTCGFEPMVPGSHRCYKQSTMATLRPAKPMEGANIVGEHIFQGENQCNSSVGGQCARMVHKAPSLQGYDLCGVGGGHMHAESVAIIRACRTYHLEHAHALQEALTQVAYIQTHAPKQPELQAFMREGFVDASLVIPAYLHKLLEPYEFTLTIVGHRYPCEMCRQVCVTLGIYHCKATGLAVDGVERMQVFNLLDGPIAP